MVSFNKSADVVHGESHKDIDGHYGDQGEEDKKDGVGQEGKGHLHPALVPVVGPSKRRLVLEENFRVVEFSRHHH